MLTLSPMETNDPESSETSTWVGSPFCEPFAVSPPTPAPLTGMFQFRTSCTPEPSPNTEPAPATVPTEPELYCVGLPFCEPLPTTPATPAPSSGELPLSAMPTSEPGLSRASA